MLDSQAKIGWIYLLPSETLKVIAKYHPKWMISVVLANTAREITAVKRLFDSYDNDTESKQLKIKVPNLILSHSLQRPWAKFSKIESYFSINAIDLTRTDAICTVPYRLANVYTTGNICFGDVALDKNPTNLRQAHNYFWSSSFNEDNCPFLDQHSQECVKRNHDHYDEQRIHEQYAASGQHKNLSVNELESIVKAKCSCCFNECGCSCTCDAAELFFNWINGYYEQIKKSKYTTSTKLFCGEKYFASDAPAGALFLSNNRELLASVPERFHKNDGSIDPALIGTASLNDQIWTINLGNYSFELTNSQIEVM